ncbi:lipoprotein [Streptomyces sp. ISL-11]|uniref:lipoprotein n=1 Tax=Streptomyces sp. ISL-11 TaxID=2819174 RepID=UPI001BE762E5|nr:lipoprotein [Streptomyces sp. ISL-11]MBT2385617.1 hypothetical protein [Streptomyces sp. ISL-11]
MGARGFARAATCAALFLGALSGCGSPSGDDEEPSSPSRAGRADDAWGDKTVAPAGQEAVGGKGSPCVLPVTFRLAQSWKPKLVDSDPASGGPVRQGPVQLACEIDAKPAGYVGFLRVWTHAPAGMSARQTLQAFMAKDSQASKAKYRDTKASSLAAAEVTYLNTAPGLTEAKQERALAVEAPQGAIILQLGGLDSSEHERMLPAYQLAKISMSLTG